MKPIYIAATEQHAGKTTVSLGLFRAAQRRGFRTCFIKPVGQRYLMEEGRQIDEDAVLFRRSLSADGPIKSLSPVTIPRGFTREYINEPNPEAIYGPIDEAIAELADEHDVAIVEGTGHAGVGAVIDASNAQVAAHLGAKCIIVAGGGIGRCIDAIRLNEALFEQCDVPVIGAVINKVYEEKYDKVSQAVCKGLDRLGIKCLGAIPYRRELTFPTMRHFKEEFGLETLCGEAHMDNHIHDSIVAAMEPQNMVDYLSDDCLVVVPGDRVDNILASINAHLMKGRGEASAIGGMLLTGGFVPHRSIVKMLCAVEVPVLLTGDDTATAAFRVRGFVPKITPRDADKIGLAEELIQSHVQTEHIFRVMGLLDS